MRLAALTSLLCTLPLGAGAEEGMWTFDAFPSEQVARSYGFRPDAAWLARARLASVRLAQGCSGSLVSAGGLVMTNHHCAHSCIEELSTPRSDLVRDGFLARSGAEERPCPELEVNQLEDISDVTARMRQATAGREGEAYGEARRTETARMEKECQTSEALRCELVSLYHGGRYHLYRYRRYQDVRLVFAPELAIAFFGGDPDNFMFPRYDLDMALLRVYQGGKPAATPDHFRWSPAGPQEGELTFISGSPGRTQRLRTVAQLEYQREVVLPERLIRDAEWRGRLAGYRERGAEQARHATAHLFYAENGFKARQGELAALRDPAFFQSKVAEEARLRAALARDPAKARRYLPAFDAIARALGEEHRMRRPLHHLEQSRLRGRLFGIARTLLRGVAERQKPDGQRLEEFRDSAQPALLQELFSAAPVHPELEVFELAFALEKMREELGPDHPAVRKILGLESPAELAARSVKGSRLREVAFRRKLWEGGAGAVETAAREDAMLALVLRFDADAREVRKRYQDDVEAVVRQSEDLLAQARFEALGTSVYPDATFSPRLSFGKVAGWMEGGKAVPPFTTLGGAFARATGRPPFDLPRSWLAARERLDLSLPFNFASSNDIIGGNSGSPVFNKELEIVGLVFDGNSWSLGGDWGFDESVNRAVSVHSSAILQALSRIYGAERLARELGPPSGPAGP